MPSKVASLIIRLTDDVSGPAGKAAGALKTLASAGDGLSRLKSATAGLDQLGAKMRAARVETEKTAKELAAAEKRVEFFQRSKAAGSHNFPAFEASGLVSEAEARLRAAKRAHAAAERQMRATRGQFVEQKRAVAALSAVMGGAGAGVASLNAALSRQPARMAAATSRTAGLAKATREMGAAGHETADGVRAVSHAVASLAAPRATGIAHVTRDLAGLDRRAVTTAKLVRAITAPASLPPMSNGLKAHLSGLGLTRSQSAALARGYVRMHGEQAKTVEGIGNPAIRAQVLAADGAGIEDRLRERARAMVAEQRVADAIMAPGGSREDRAAVQAARDAAREKIAIARAAAREARQLEREAAREATQGAREAARAAREAAQAKIQAAREAAQAVKAAAREEVAATRAATREAARLTRERRRMVADLHGGLRTTAGVVGAGGALYGGARVARFATRVSAEGTREDARDYLAGVEGDSPRIRRKALDLSLQYQSVDQNTFHERLRDTALAMGSADKAFQVSDSIGKASVVLQSLKGKEKSLEEGRRFFAALDNLGKNQDPDQVRRLMDGWLKALGVEGADLDMGSLLQIARKAKSGGGGLSERFLMGVAPALSMDMGPNELGTAIGTEISQLIGGRATKQSKAYQQKIGLRDKKGNFINRDKVVSDPFAYTVEDLIPKLKAAGIDTNSDGAVIEATSKAFSQQTVANLFSKMITQRDQYERKLQQYDKAPGLAAADKLATKDPYVAAAGAVSQFGNALQTLAEPIVPAATSALNTFAGGMASLTKAMQDNPEAVKAAAVPAGLAAATLVPQTVGALMKKLAGDATGVLANGLRMGGGALSATGGLLGYGASVGVPTAMGAAANEAPTVNDQGVPNLLAGKESPTARIARELVEARRQQMTPEGRRAALQERIDREHGVIAGLTRAQPEGPAHPAAATIADARARIARLTREHDAIAAGAPAGPAPAASVSAPTPPARPPEFTLGGISAVPAKLAAYRAELAGIERQLAGLQASGEAAFSPDLPGLEARKAEILAAIADIEAKLKALKPVAFEVTAPDFAPVVTAGAEGGTQAGVSAGQGVAKGIEQSSPEAIEKGRTLFERLKGLFQGGIDVPINLNVEGGGGAGVHRASWVSLPAETRASFVRAASRAGGGGGVHPGRGATGLAGGEAASPHPAPAGAGAPPEGAVRTRAAAMYDALRGQGFGHLHASALLGHQMEESTMNPSAWNPDERAGGTIQWRLDRLSGLQAHAREQGRDWRDPVAQASWIKREMATSEAASGRRFMGADSLEAMSAALKGYIRYGSNTAADRLGHARTFERLFRGRQPGDAPAPVAQRVPERPAIPGMMPGAERVNPGYGKPLHQGGTGLSRYSDDDLRAMAARQDALERAKAPPAASDPDRLEAARRAIQGRYPAPAPAAPAPAPTAVPGLSRPAPGTTPSGVPAIAPKVDLNQVSAAGTQAAATLTQLQGLNTTLTPQVDTSSLSAALALVRSFNAEIAKAGPAIAAAAAQAGSLRAPAGGASGGGAAPASTGMVRRELANNFA